MFLKPRYLYVMYTLSVGQVTLQRILNFFTGAEVPPHGFLQTPVLNFNTENVYPTASTCAVHLTFPVKYYCDYEGFERAMNTALLYHGGFGLV